MSFDDENVPTSPFDDSPEAFDFLGDEEDTEVPGEDENEGSNKTFLIAVAALIAFLVIAMALLAAYAVFFVPSKRSAQQTQAAQIDAQNTAIAQGLTATAQAALWTDTPEPTQVPTATPVPPATPTPVVAQPTPTQKATTLVDPTAFALTATAVYAANEAAAALTPSPTALAQTGFADEVGLPGLLAAAVLLMVVIFLARRLRQAV